MQTLIIHTETPTTLPPTVTPAPTMTPTPVPIIVSRPTVTPTQVGSFTLNYTLTPDVDGVLPIVELPTWIESSGERETWALEQVTQAYQPLLTPCDWEVSAEIFKSHYRDVLATADDFLGAFPNSDGAIPVLMMLGHVHSYQVGWYWGRSAELLGQEYEKAITLLLERHPERLPYILNDLIEMGLPINWVENADLNVDDQVLLFTYQFSSRFSEPKGQVYTLVQECDRPPTFTPLSTRYAEDWQHGVRVETIADINADGQTEIVVELIHSYAGGPGLKLHVFVWQDSTWTDRLSWHPTTHAHDAYYGTFWLEDLDEDDVQEIVVHYRYGSIGDPYTIDVYQWDYGTGVYTNTLPITVQLCGHHALAEAERRRAQGDLEGAVPWYEEARRRWLEELDAPHSTCSSHRSWNKYDIANSCHSQILVQRTITSTGTGGWGIYPLHLNDGYQVVVGEHIFTETKTPTGMFTIDQSRVNILQCDALLDRVVGRFYPVTFYTQIWASGDRAICAGGTRRDYDDHDKDGWSDLRQVTHWDCRVEDTQGVVSFGQDGPYIETTCLWDGSRFVLSGSQTLTPTTVLTGTLAAYPQLVGIEKTLSDIVDCSGDE